jgi:PilZ domain/SPOR domain
MERHAYINIEPNNGGIVLNVSDGGLCFHSFDPVKPNGTVRLWFSDQSQRIEAAGAVAWTDETQKGGLRFTEMPAEARERIREWISHPAASLPANPGSIPVSALREGAASDDPKDVSDATAPFLPVSPGERMPIRMSGFSRGLATGLVISALVVCVFLFNGYRREFGEWLIKLGEGFAAKPQTQTLVVSAAPPVVAATPQTVPAASPAAPTAVPTVAPIVPAVTQTVLSAPQKISPAPVPAPVSQSEKVTTREEKVVPQALPIQPKPQVAKLDPPAVIAPTPVSEPTPKIPAQVIDTQATVKPQPTPVPTSAPLPAVVSASNIVSPPSSPAPKPESASQSGVQTEASTTANPAATSELYFEVGKFKNPLQAHDETDKLAQLGFPATAVKKNFLWANSYHILVGPYGDEEHARATHEGLLSSGFKPRTFERGSRDFTLSSPVKLGGARTPEGDYTIRWESYIGDASVKFMRNNSVVAEADGKWVKHEPKYQRDAYVYRRNPDGSRTLLEIHFEGMHESLVF